MPRKQKSPTGATVEGRLEELAGLRMTNPERVLFAELGVTKLGLATYYASIADWILPQIADRPLSLLRCPEGGHKGCFYQKHVRPGTPEVLRRVPIVEKGKTEEYLAVDNLAGLISLVQLGVLEIHPWGARTDNVEKPDLLILDLDPAPEVAWPRVIGTAFQVRDLLAEVDLRSFVKTTGGKGLHIVVPLQRRQSWAEVKAFARAVAARIAQTDPGSYTLTMSKAARRGKIYLDYLRNDRGATAVAPFSTRAHPGATVAMPLRWDELTPAIRSDHFNIENTLPRLAALRTHPWNGFRDVRQSVTKRMQRHFGL